MKNANELAELLLDNTSSDLAGYVYLTLLSKRKILISTEIDDMVVEKVIIPLLEMTAEGGEPIEILINTPGGNLYDGMIICNIIDETKVPTTITLLGSALSLGGHFALAGANNPLVTKRCYPFSILLLHCGSFATSGSADRNYDIADFNKQYENKLRDYVISHSKITPKEYDEKRRSEWFMDADTMLEKGIVDYIIGKPKAE